MPVPGCLTNITSNSLSPIAVYYHGYGVYNFYHDNWCSIVTDIGDHTDHWSFGNETQYFDRPLNQYYNIYNRIPYSLYLSPDWILLCVGTADFNITCTSGYLMGSVMGRFSPPEGFNIAGSTLFVASTQIGF